MRGEAAASPRRQPARTARVGAALLLALAAAVVATAMSRSGPDGRDSPARAAPVAPVTGSGADAAARSTSEGMFVDRDSVGGRCDDGRDADEADSEATPWCSLERAVAAAGAGSVVHVRAGRYPPLTVSGDSGRSEYLTLRSFPAEEVVLNGFTVERSEYVRLQGFRIVGPSVIGPSSRSVVLADSRLGPYGLTIQDGSSQLRIEGNHITVPLGSAIHFSSSYSEPEISDVSILGNHLEDIGVAGINLRNFRNVLVEDNEIEGVHRWNQKVHPDVIRTYHGGTGLVVRRNYLHDNAAIGFFIKDGKAFDVTLENNVIVRTRDFYALQIFDVDSLRVVNNTLADNEYGTVFQGVATGVVLKNNLLDSLNIIGPTRFDYEDYNYAPRGRPGPKGRHDLSRGVVFESSGGIDYGLAARSAGLDAGTSVGAPTRDRLGNRRVDLRSVRNSGDGCRRYYDMGAQERRERRTQRRPRCR